MLKSASLVKACSIEIEHDCWRFISQGKGTPSAHRGYFLYGRHDFGRLPMLPADWWYYLNQHGEGKKIDFPMKIKPVIAWSPKKHVLNGENLIEPKRFPIEKRSISFSRLPCNKKIFNT